MKFKRQIVRHFSNGAKVKFPLARASGTEFNEFDGTQSPSKINYHNKQYFKDKPPTKFKRVSFRTYEMRGEEEKRVKQMARIVEEAQEAEEVLELNLGIVLERLPIILPDIQEHEVPYYKMRHEKDLLKKKIYPTANLDMGRRLQGENSDLPHNVAPWVYDSLSRNTEELGPYLKYHNLKERLETLDYREQDIGDYASQKAQNKEKGEEIGSDTDMRDFIDDFDIEVDIIQDEETQAELKKVEGFRPAERYTEDDKNNNIKSLYRKYQNSLFYIVQTKQQGWRFPQFNYLNELKENEIDESSTENLREVAEIITKNKTKAQYESDLYFPGNAPAAFIHEKNNLFKKGEKEKFGESIFFYRGQVIQDIFDDYTAVDNSGRKKRTKLEFNKISGDEIINEAWVTKEDVRDLLKNSENEVELRYWDFCIKLIED